MTKRYVSLIVLGVVIAVSVTTAAALLPVGNVPGPMAPSSAVQPAASGEIIQHATADIQASHNICLQVCR